MSQDLPETTYQQINATGPKGIPLESILKLANKGHTQAEIARSLGVSRSVIHRRLKDYGGHIEALPDFRAQRADILALHQRIILSLLTPSEYKKMSPYQLVGMLNILHQQERLERDLSTSNVSTHVDLRVSLDTLKAQYRAIEDAHTRKSGGQE